MNRREALKTVAKTVVACATLIPQAFATAETAQKDDVLLAGDLVVTHDGYAGMVVGFIQPDNAPAGSNKAKNILVRFNDGYGGLFERGELSKR